MSLSTMTNISIIKIKLKELWYADVGGSTGFTALQTSELFKNLTK